ncbi:helicase-exonuclease AddAB subunit AddA [Paucilactobacillus suebicus]|uniref:ATP-dependent helicase/nuclease subunit A n=1 Tax=Paucilactobacillus suebicus DSM 5007 = KCTC 3549 TaxID=1423807 RepID=A0A0R1W4B5_9LACO|nr:helicase-exonuclease AddAB subunit AddA [Paucilactobacillus suebicus]KRM12673.1 ATP-dependent nuclease subunit A [Paucilactobacillus suebicus DSM 5007 = KCTC 3549]
MSSTQFTEKQQQAIDDQGQNILVSASAGSGKTSVLVERVIQKILRGESIDRLLVVTFTDAAAKGMRDRIAQALKDAINSTNDAKIKKHLKKQLNRLAVADISTLHAFCLHLIKEYYYLIDLDPQFRLLTDSTEGILLREAVWDDVREERYASNDESFEQLTRNFSSDRSDDGLTDVVNMLDGYATATPKPQEWLDQLPNDYDLGNEPFTQSDLYRQQLLPIIDSTMSQIQADLDDAISAAGGDAFAKVIKVLDAEYQQAKHVQSVASDGTWDDLRTLMIHPEFKRLTGPKGEDAADFESIKALRKTAKDAFTDLAKSYFALSEDELRNISSQVKPIIETLVDVVKQYREAYQAEKQQRHVLDFSDLEHYALQILTTQSENGQAVVAQLKDHYYEIMVDEYQDTNQLQESILQTLVTDNPGNMFMVGDVKQSIYQFRQADPSLFMGKYNRYRANTASDGEAIVLAENFRSVNNVTDFTNLIFEQLMDEQVGEMNYDDDAHLKFGAQYYPKRGVPAEVMLFDSEHKEESALEQKLPHLEPDDKLTGEIQMVALRIKKMVDNQEQIYDRKTKEKRAITYGDITLLAATKHNNNLIIEQFSNLDIPVTVHDAQNYFQATEVRIMMALLRIIDNPYQDIPLAAVLRSPMVGLDENELAYLRIQDKTDDYYGAIKRFANSEPEDEFASQLHDKIVRFLERLKRFRLIANQNRLVELIWTIYNETGFLDYVGGMPGGKQRQANLHALYQRAASYEQSSFKGVFQFVRFIEQMQKKDKDLAEAPSQTSSNTVSVMTIHGSKGLEFPVVFLIDATHRFNRENSKRSCLVDAHNGIGITYLRDDNVRIPTLQRQILQDTINKKAQAEEMRLLYVALTRAEQRLIVTGSYDGARAAIEKWQRAFQSQRLLLPDQLREKSNNFMDWIGMSLIRHPQFDSELMDNDEPWYGLGKDSTTFNVSVMTAEDLVTGELGKQDDDTSVDDQFEKVDASKLSGEERDAITQVMQFEYPHQAATMTTAYQSVSEIKRLFEDPDNHELIQLELNPQARSKGRYVKSDFGQPQFVHHDETASPTEIGTATHLVLQTLDVEQRPTSDDIEQVIAGLQLSGVISNAVATKINRDEVSRFFDTPLGKQVVEHHDSLYREAPFSMLLNGNQLFTQLTSEDEKILIHGIIDGYFDTDEGLVLFDYKTDHVIPDNPISIQKVVDRYRGQVNLYARALKNMTGKPVVHKYLYLLEAGTVELE